MVPFIELSSIIFRPSSREVLKFTSQNLSAYSFKKIDLVAFLPSLMTLT